MTKLRSKKVTSDILYSFGAVLLLQGSIQFIIYPIINAKYGREAFGNILYIYSFIAIFAASIGGSANNFRMVNKESSTNGDYLLSLFVLTIPCAIIFCFFIAPRVQSAKAVIALIIVLLFTILRYYSVVDFWSRHQLKKYFLYYCMIVAGYLIGLLIMTIVGSWQWVFIVGESGCLIYILLRKNIYTNPLKISPNRGRVFKGMIALMGANLLYNVIVNLDRTLLLHLLDANSVTVYYVASLIGRMFAIIVGPLNGILITYLSRNNEQLSRRRFVFLCLGILAISGLFYIGTIVITPVFIKIMYPDIYESAINIYLVTNMSQIICFAGSMVLITVLTFTNEKYQLIIQGICTIMFIGLAITLTPQMGLTGFVYSGLVANTMRFILAFVLGVLVKRRIINRQ